MTRGKSDHKGVLITFLLKITTATAWFNLEVAVKLSFNKLFNYLNKEAGLKPNEMLLHKIFTKSRFRHTRLRQN